MLSENLAISIMTASITGAGLVIAFYALLARMSERIFENRFAQLDTLRERIKQIKESSDSFKEKNLKATTSSLNEIRKEIKAIKTFPKYLGLGVGIDFVLFLLAALTSYGYFIFPNVNELLILALFPLATILFLAVGIYGIFDVATTVASNFEELKKEKEEAKKEVLTVQKGGKEIIDKLISIFSNGSVNFERESLVKIGGITLLPDFVVPNKHNPKYLIEVIAKPTHNLLDNLASKYLRLSEENVTTIIVSAFNENDDLLRIAETYWNHVVDVKNLNKIEEIVKN